MPQPTDLFGTDPNAPATGASQPRDLFAPPTSAPPAASPAPSDTPDGTINQGLGFYQRFTHGIDRQAQGAEYLAGMFHPSDLVAPGLADSISQLTGHPVPTVKDTLNQVGSWLGMPTTQSAIASHRAYVKQQEAAGQKPGGWGQFAGDVTATAPLMFENPIAGGATAGMVMGDSDTPLGLAGDAAKGAAAGYAGSKLVGAASRVIAPKIDPYVQKLLSEGVDMTPGQLMGGMWKGAEDRAAGFPVLRTIIGNAKASSLDSFNVAAVNRALAPVGESLPDEIPAGYAAVDHAVRVLDEKYGEVLPNLTVRADQPFLDKIQNLHKLATNLPGDNGPYFESKLKEYLGQFENGQMDGDTMKGVEEDLSKEVSEFGRGTAVERKLSNAFRQVQTQLRELTVRSNPDQAPVLQKINQGYANLLRVQRAAQSAPGGVFTPAQLQTATRVLDPSKNKRLSATGQAMMQDLADAARRRLPSSIPDPGTAGQLIGADAAYQIASDTGQAALALKAAAPLAGAVGLYSRYGKAATRALLTKRPAVAKPLANAVSSLRRPAGVAGAASTVDTGEP